MQEKGNNKKIVLGIIGLVVILAVAGIAYMAFGPKAAKGSKAITVTVVDAEGKETAYNSKTDAEFLRQAMEEIKELKIEGEDGDYGLYIKAVNGIRADYDLDGAYWSLLVNGEYGTLSADQQPVVDGDTYTLKYEKAN